MTPLSISAAYRSILAGSRLSSEHNRIQTTFLHTICLAILMNYLELHTPKSRAQNPDFTDAAKLVSSLS
ncbi:hypothetical protein HDU79_000481, partial [Rhizoclosmatium sp. JEL0117]